MLLTTSLFAEIKAIVSKDSEISSISQKQLKKLFLGKTKKFHGHKVVVVDNTSSSEEFNKKVLKKSKNQIHSYWMKQIFLGKRIPPQKVEQKEINNLLNSNNKVITYTNQNMNQNVKVIHEIK